MSKDDLVSVVITTRNEAQVIETLLKSLQSQTHSPLEIIVVDNGSTDETVDIAQKYTKKVFQYGPERSAQRNYGAEKSTGNYLLFLDADMEISSNVIKECVDEIMITNTAAVVIPEISVGKTYWEKVKAFERSFYIGSQWTDAARFYKKEIFNKSGKFDETITGPEDWDLSETVRRQGYKIGRTSAVIYHHERISSPLKMAQKMYYYGLKSYRSLSKQQTGVFSPKTIYLLRKDFYTQGDKFLKHPVLALGMIVMLSLQLAGGGLGYLVGKINNA
jgi:glycosyltransferase involved in cell wall biosynthesis